MSKKKKNISGAVESEDIPRNTRATVSRLFLRLARQKKKLLVVVCATLLSSTAFAAIPLAVGVGVDNLVNAI